MTIHTILEKGEYHSHHCEDYLFHGKIGDNKTLAAVIDGCSMATDSYFVSTLIGKLLRKIVKEWGYKEMYNLLPAFQCIEDNLKEILRDLFLELNKAKAQLMLEREELFSTLILLLLDEKERKGIVLVIGDGIVSVDGVISEFDQVDKPDYLGYHLIEDFDDWYKKQEQKVEFENVEDVSIATDGVFTFTKLRKSDADMEIDVVKYLLTDESEPQNPEMLGMKVKKLEKEMGLVPTDDLAIVRISGLQ